jgi:hypothetical protein
MINLTQTSMPYRWLAVSRERRGWIFYLCCPESEKSHHGDHHADPGIANDHIAAVVDARLHDDPTYLAFRKVVYGLFSSPYGEAAYSSLMRGRAGKRHNSPFEEK